MEVTGFAPLGVLQLPSQSRLPPSACCPDKDLVALVSRLGDLDRLSLWNYHQGSKVWEVSANSTNGGTTEIVAIAWSPDGQSIAAAHNPPEITLHSLQDGSLLFTLPFSGCDNPPMPRITGIWWFHGEKLKEMSLIPDIFRRKNIIPGTALSILKHLPLLDSLENDSQKSSAIDLFAFQGSQIKAMPRSSNPTVINQWPTLLPHPVMASIGSTLAGGEQPNENKDASENLNVNGLLVAADDRGSLHCYLDGSFPLSAVFVGPTSSILSVFKYPNTPTFSLQMRATRNNTGELVTFLQPTSVHLPLLTERKHRDLAQLSSTARELLSYLLRLVKDMHSIWFGSESISGARDFGIKWVQALEARQREQYGQQNPYAILDLTALLVTGRATDSLLDFLGSSEQMSERGLQKWETTMTEVLIKLRDTSERRIMPACQRLHLVLEELQGWSQLQQYSSFQLQTQDINDCLNIAARVILLTAWLAATARKDLSRFKEFVTWLRFETLTANPTNDNAPQPRHDILQVNNYLISGLLDSPIDKWFTGPIPSFTLGDFAIPDGHESIPTILERVRSVLDDPNALDWQANTREPDLDHIDRNIDALLHDLAARSRRIFDRAAGAACRTAVVSSNQNIKRPGSKSKQGNYMKAFISRERTIFLDEHHEVLQYVALSPGSEYSVYLCIVRLRFSEALEAPVQVAVTLLERFLQDESENKFDLLETDFFDDESLAIVYRLRNQKKAAYIATVTYHDLEYEELGPIDYDETPTREHLLWKIMESWERGDLPSSRHGMKRCWALSGCRGGEVALAVKRRVGCVLDVGGGRLECVEMEDIEQ